MSQRLFSSLATLTESQAREILAKAPRSLLGNTIPITRIYYYQKYREIAQKRAVFYIQMLNLNALEYTAFRLEFIRAGFGITVIRNRVYQAALRDLINETSTINTEGNVEKLKGMFVGPMCVVHLDMPELDAVVILNRFVKAISKFSNRSLVAGAMLDRMVLSLDEISSVRKEYPMGVGALHSELLGILEASRRGVIDCLEVGAKNTVMLLEQHGRNLDDRGEAK